MNQMKLDPTRTTTLRRKFVNEMKRRFRSLDKAHRVLIVEEDAFGLSDESTLMIMQKVTAGKLDTNKLIDLEVVNRKEREVNQMLSNQERQAWRFLSNPQKVTAYRSWLQQQINAKVLTVDAMGKPWTATYVDSAYRKGMIRSYTESRKAELIAQPTIFQGGQAEFLRSAFAAPVVLSKIEVVSMRAYKELKGVTDVMSQQLSRIIATNLATGANPRQLAKQIHDSIGAITRQRANTIARTETIYAHAEGQLDSFERLNIEKVGAMAEWQTAGDERVCELCYPLEGVVMSIKEARGLIPRHPNCRCMWMPASSKQVLKAQKRGAAKKSALAKSIDAERVKGTLAEKRAKSPWLGKTQLPAKK